MINKTPLRYPGGKQKLTPFVEEILVQNNVTGHYVEPYAGGAGVALELLLTRKIQHIHLNDANRGIYAFWHSVINNTEKLCRLISTASMTIEEWKYRKEVVNNSKNATLLELGFSIFFLNRCNRSGILSAGVIGGNDQSGNYKMDARFSKIDLIRRIEAISVFKKKITITNHDAEYYIDNYIPNLDANTLVYLDPPYYEQGGNLYLNSYSHEDHENLAKTIQKKIKHKWILSYDGIPEIVKLYYKRRHFIYDLQYNAEKVYLGKEIFIFSDKVKIPGESKLKFVNTGIENLIIPA